MKILRSIKGGFIILGAVLLSPSLSMATPPPPQIQEIMPQGASELGFQVTVKHKGAKNQFNVQFPEKIDDWDIPRAPRITVYDGKGNVILETFPVYYVSNDGTHPLSFILEYNVTYDLSITFWYGGKSKGQAGKGFRIPSVRRFQQDK